ncbi:peptide deformylase [Methylococcus capsulatus]|uniref:peptide deformylase n=1 Tax=Methylococcus capsulatus TaxID=414 RepID=UPI001C52B1F8|nr:peptide deformylase [Methylococcus capsulatus]QXP87921.1 peptide deformylase [Methylococcus capsulatus]QXP92339.1 peptide deformylase [Methylococcus capsulatus]
MDGLALRLKIVQAGEPVLRQRARPLSPEEIRSAAVQALIGHMRETMRDAPGVGLAAPQIGQGLQLAVIEDRADYHRGLSAEELAARGREPVPFHVIVNPEIVARSEETDVFHEGCLSLAGFSARVERARWVRVSCLDHRGEPQTIEASGWYARILQHEIDHLHGGLYIDRMDPRSFTTQPNHVRYGDIETS